MIIKFSLVRFAIISSLVILFPLVQNQWLNLYLFDINNFSIYKLLYYLSGLICPILVSINSLNKFTYFKFSDKNIKKDINITGKALFIVTSIFLITLSILIFNYFVLNLKLISNLFIDDYVNKFQLGIDKKIFLLIITSILLLFNKIKYLVKKIILINFFMITIFIWYSQVKNILLDESIYSINFLKFENINFLNVLFLLIIEILYYSWAYISYKSNLSDWNIPIPYKRDYLQIFKIITFYLLIILYYSLLLK